MRILQYNIYFGDHPTVTLDTRIDNICKYILGLELSPDIVCLQEVRNDKYEYMVNSLKKEYPYIYPDPEDGLGAIYGTMILSKYRILRSSTYKYEITAMGRDIKTILVVDDDGNKYYIATTHFESEFGHNHQTKLFQYKKCVDVLQQLYEKTHTPVILCADTNVCKKTEFSFYNAFNFSHKWKDSLYDVTSASKSVQDIMTLNPIMPYYTFDSATNPILIAKTFNYRDIGDNANTNTNNNIGFQSRLDRIMHLSNLSVSTYQTMGQNNYPPTDPKYIDNILSDHYGVMCQFVRKDQQTLTELDNKYEIYNRMLLDLLKHNNMNDNDTKNKKIPRLVCVPKHNHSSADKHRLHSS